MRHTAVLIPGDGIGPEVADACRTVLHAAGAPVDWEVHHAGSAAIDRGEKSLLPQSTLDAILRHGVALKGPITTPIGGGFTSINVTLRKALDLYAAVRPVRSIEGVPTRFTGVDLVIVRENTEGLYSGIEHTLAEGVVASIKVATDKASRRIARYAFEYAREHRRKKVSVFHKANIMKLSDGLFIRCAKEEWQKSYSEIEYEEVIVDAGCMKLVSDPSKFDVILSENLYGDILSDLCAGLVGGLGVCPGSNIGEKGAVFEAVHGSAPDIAGRNLANPLALLKSAVMMLRYLAQYRRDERCGRSAETIERAMHACLAAGRKTRDLGGMLGTREFAAALSAECASPVGAG